MKLKSALLLIALTSILYGCRTKAKTSYAIRNFNDSLRPYLTHVVSVGVLGFDSTTAYVERHATDSELVELSKSEHPVLRALAFREMLTRPGFDHFKLIMDNLADTAVALVDFGEWGFKFRRVSDDMLEHGRWKDSIAKDKTIKEVILNHNYLSSAKDHLFVAVPNEAFYPSIKRMTQRELGIGDEFDQAQAALLALAGYKKAEDVPYIKQRLSDDVWRLTETSFWLMQDYPNECYLEIYENYFLRHFYRNICKDQKFYLAESFIRSVATQQNSRSEKILGSMLDRKPFMPCAIDTALLKRVLIFSIWENPCSAYSKILKKVQSDVRRYKAQDEMQMGMYLPSIDVDSALFVKDTSRETIRW